MRNAMILLVAVVTIWMAPARADTVAEILALEKSGLDGWLKGDPGPQLATLDAQITYFHAVVEQRLEGLPAVKQLYERFRGVPLFDSYQMLTPKVQVLGDVAVLTYVLAQHTRAGTTFWNGTQVYQMKKEGWRVIHTHWSKGNAPENQ